MSALAATQAAFQDFLLGGDPAIAAEVAQGAGIAADARLGIYRHAYRARLREVLAEDYPGVAALAGREGFAALASGYLDRHPSTDPDARWFGRHFPAYLLEAGIAPADRELLAEMARLEWALGLAYDAPDAPCVGLDAVAALPPGDWPGLAFGLHPSVHRLELRWNVAAIRASLDAGEELALPERGEASRPWLAWRRSLVSRHRPLEPDEAAALDAVAAGSSFADLCEGLLLRHAPEAAFVRAASLLRRWIDEELLVAAA